MWRVVERLKEPSTWAGFACLGSVFGIKELVALGVPEVGAMMAAGAAALAAIFMPEKK